jgi:hypothetical protein
MTLSMYCLSRLVGKPRRAEHSNRDTQSRIARHSPVARQWRMAAGGSLAALLLALAAVPAARATSPDAADHSFKQFLAKDDGELPYRATRRLEAENGSRHGWMNVVTQYTPRAGFRYDVIAEGGSDYIRDKVLRAVLNAERDAYARGEMFRAALAPENYAFEPNGVGADGLSRVLISPRRKEPALIQGTMFLTPQDGALVRLQGRLAKSPSFWVKSVEVVRAYRHFNGNVVPIALESKAQLRMLGSASLRMTYRYSEIDGSPVDLQ